MQKIWAKFCFALIGFYFITNYEQVLFVYAVSEIYSMPEQKNIILFNQNNFGSVCLNSKNLSK